MSALDDALDFVEDNNTIDSGVSVSAARIELKKLRSRISELELKSIQSRKTITNYEMLDRQYHIDQDNFARETSSEFEETAEVE